MCGRMILGDYSWATWYAIVNGFVNYQGPVKQDEPVQPRYNIKPTNQHPIFYQDASGTQITDARWWFVPHWFKGTEKDWKATTFNARIETAHEKPVFRTAWKSGRCIVPVTGYYEWTGTKGNKQPWVISLKQNNPIFFFAGLSSTMKNGISTFSILTRVAAPQIGHIHHRMPVMLNVEEIDGWLDKSVQDDEVIESFGTGWDDQLSSHKVAKFGMKDDGPEMINPIEA